MARPGFHSIALLLAIAPAASGATESPSSLTVYRCTAPDGTVTLQDLPCPPGESEDARRYVRPPPVVAPPPPATPAETPPAPAAPEPLRVTIIQPEPLYDCRRPDGSQYESRSGVPGRHWVGYSLVLPSRPLRPDPSALPGPLDPPRTTLPGALPVPPPRFDAVIPGYWVEDHCWRLTQAEACARRQAHLQELERRWRLAFPSERERIGPEREALRAQLRSECAGR